MTFTINTDGRGIFDEVSTEQLIEWAGDWRDPLPAPPVAQLSHAGGKVNVIDDSHTGWGTKGRWLPPLLEEAQRRGIEELVYVAPRVCWAGISLARRAQSYGIQVTLFMPASKQASPHQLVAIEAGARPVFRRIAAMPVLNKMAKEYAEEQPHRRYFMPLGCKHALVMAAGIVSTRQHFADIGPHAIVWCAVSTGMLTSTLQRAWPNAQFAGTVVARNIHPGETGRSTLRSYDKPFQAASRLAGKLGINSAVNYDLKAIEDALAYSAEHPDAQIVVWNVAGEVRPEHLTPADVDSQRAWGEIR